MVLIRLSQVWWGLGMFVPVLELMKPNHLLLVRDFHLLFDLKQHQVHAGRLCAGAKEEFE
jgi:hypothetical protein